MKTLSAILLAGVLGALPLLVACGKEESPSPGKLVSPGSGVAAPPAALPQDAEAENPDRGRWVDLATHPFRSEWVGGTLVVARRAGPVTLNNLLWTGGETRGYAKHFLYPYLLMEEPDRQEGAFRVRPWAAAALPERLPDDRTYVWKLKEGLTWEDGHPVTAEDYAYTWELLQDPEVDAAERRSQLERVEAVVARDERTLEVRFKEPYYNALVSFGLEFTVVPAHATPRDPAAFNPLRRHLSFGPYRVVHQDDQRLQVELRPEYLTRPHPTGPHYARRVEFRFVRDPAAQFRQLRAGMVHVGTVSHDQYDGLADDPEFQEHCWRTFYYLPAYVFVAWNFRDPSDPTRERPHPLFGDPRVRRAMTHLIPRERLRNAYYHGRAVLVSGPFFFMDADYDRDVPLVAFDPERARELLAEAGWALNQQGYLEKEGRVFRFTLVVPQGSPELQGPATPFAEAARQVGAEVVVQELHFFNIMEKLKTGDFDAFLLINSLRPPIEPDQFELFHSSQVGLGAQNWVGLADPRVDQVIERYRIEFDREERRRIRKGLHRLIDEIHPFSFLYSAASCVAVGRSWANVKVHDLGIFYRDFVWRELWERFPPE